MQRPNVEKSTQRKPEMLKTAFNCQHMQLCTTLAYEDNCITCKYAAGLKRERDTESKTR